MVNLYFVFRWCEWVLVRVALHLSGIICSHVFSFLVLRTNLENRFFQLQPCLEFSVPLWNYCVFLSLKTDGKAER
jgi:hypothetical protein